MRRRVVWAQAAWDDHLEAIRCIARDDPDAAMRVAEKIEAAGDALAAFATGRPGRVHGTYEKVFASEILCLPGQAAHGHLPQQTPPGQSMAMGEPAEPVAPAIGIGL